MSWVQAARNEVPAGCCPYCDNPIVQSGKGRPRFAHCGGKECKRLWEVDRQRDFYSKNKALRQERAALFRFDGTGWEVGS